MKHPESNVSAGPSSGPGSRLPSWRTHFLHCPGAPVRGKLGLTEQRRSAFDEPTSTSLPNKVFIISEHIGVSPNYQCCLEVALKKQRVDFQFFGLVRELWHTVWSASIVLCYPNNLNYACTESVTA